MPKNHSTLRLLLFLTLFTMLLGVQLACGLGTPAESGDPEPSALATRVAPKPTEVLTIEMPPSVPEQHMLTLEFPPAIRAGDSDVVRLTLEVDDQGNLTPTAETQGNVTTGKVISVPNVYATHNIMAEARLDLAGVEVRPGDLVSETLLPGQTAIFYWSVQPLEVGKYKGTVWFYLRFVPKDGGPDSRQALSAQLIEIESTSFLGLKANPARWIGMIGTVISSVLGLPFLEGALKWVWSRVRKRA